MARFLPVFANWAGGVGVSDVMEMLSKPEVESSGTESSILLHAAQLLAGKDVEAESVSTCDGLLDVEDHS